MYGFMSFSKTINLKHTFFFKFIYFFFFAMIDFDNLSFLEVQCDRSKVPVTFNLLLGLHVLQKPHYIIIHPMIKSLYHLLGYSSYLMDRRSLNNRR